MKINIFLGGAIAIGAVALVTWLLMPAERISQGAELISRLQGNQGVLCLDYERLSLSDPDAAKLRSYYKLNGGNDVSIKYSAKNAYGAYISAEAICSIRDGKVNALSTSMARTNAELDKHIACLAAKKKDMDDANPNMNGRYGDCTRNLMPLK